MRRYKPLLVPALALSLLLQACGAANFGRQLRLSLALSGPLINSLVQTGAIPESLRVGLITDFTDLGTGAATLGEELEACDSKACKLNAVQKYSQLFNDVAARGHFGAHERIQNIQIIVQGIIDAARIYYGGPSTAAIAVSPDEAKKTIERKLKELEQAMKAP